MNLEKIAHFLKVVSNLLVELAKTKFTGCLLLEFHFNRGGITNFFHERKEKS